jgi:ribosome modulation factor
MSGQVTDSPQTNVPNETILYYYHELARSARRLDEANSAHRLMVKRAKNDGAPTDAILENIKLSRRDPEARRSFIIDRIRVEAARDPQNGATLTDLIARLDTRVSDGMRHTDTLFDAEQKGYLAGKFGHPAESCPYPQGTEMAQTWRNHWGQGQALHAASMGPDAKAADTRLERRPRGGRPRLVTLPLEDPNPQPARRRRARRGRAAAPNGEATA